MSTITETMQKEQYALTDEQLALQEEIRVLADGPVAAGAAHRDKTGEYPQDMFDLLVEKNYLALPFAPEHGGRNSGILSCVLAIEGLTRACYNTSYLLMMTWQPFFAISAAGNEEQRRKYLPGLANGTLRFSTANTEPEVGSDMANLQTRAERVDGGYLLNGKKVWAGNAPVSDYFVTFARTGEPGHRGLSSFVVPTTAEGVVRGAKMNKIGGRAIPSCEVEFNNVFVPAEDRLGAEGDGFKTAASTFTKLRPLVGARALGLAQGSLDHAVSYAKDRKAFGQRIADFQGLQWMLADMKIGLEASRHLVYKSAAVLDGGMSPRDAAPLIGVAKTFATDTAMQITLDGIQIFGAKGYSTDYPMERFMREAKGLQIIEGTNQIQRNIIAKDLLS
ncbi:acyl-CoA dehydrogenase family protein [Arthrobacter tumbae]|uniref:acyl-CoA dehydrogenase family protein n=1 Tax=Arthrobacter tumbae TaxID=163874 RepID=UPI00195E8C99|nr:acyl-CoA dehydrogenase family protein [Arthrobacter tumbae]MBM7781945.1 alkylation response protein AidB-like acyl-CoA dehydrogenase [Arthrobacter tumbae]